MLPAKVATVALAAMIVSPAIGGAQSAAPSTVKEVSFWKASEAFAKGPMIVDRMASNRYQVFAVRRDAPGAVEQHVLDTDIVLVLEGSATFVTGGVITDQRARGANELTGSGIRDGNPRRVGKGDIIVVPNGTPHWFQDVSPAIRYFAVKLRQASADVRVPASVQYWPGAEAFAKGGLIFQGGDGPFVRIYALRRDKPLGVELHGLDTDLVFMVSGGGTFVTSGTITEPRPLGPNESTGTAVAGGIPHPLAPGDVLVVPAGTPHHLREIDGAVEFFAVKVR